MIKNEITREELSQWITVYIQDFEGCEDCIATVKYKLREPDEEGCNWSTDITVRLGEKGDVYALEMALNKAVKLARKQFLVV